MYYSHFARIHDILIIVKTEWSKKCIEELLAVNVYAFMKMLTHEYIFVCNNQIWHSRARTLLCI